MKLPLNPKTLLVTTTLALVGSCSSGGGGVGGGNPAANEPTVEDMLTGLGINMDTGLRLSDDGTALPDSYAPMGTFWDLEQFDELLRVGWRPQLFKTGDRSTAPIQLGVGPSDVSGSWWPQQNTSPGFEYQPVTYRAAAPADLDGDGAPELAAVYYVTDGTSPDHMQLRLRVQDPQQGDLVSSDVILAEQQDGVTHVALVALDLDGDGRDELAVAYSDAGGTRLLLVDDELASFAILDTRHYGQELFSSKIAAMLDAGNLDDDAAEELVILISERTPNDGNVRYAIIDDVETGFAQLRLERVAGLDSDDGTFVGNARMANLDVANIDSDQRDEILFAGKTAIGDVHGYTLIALDDGVHGFAELAVERFSHPDNVDYRWMRINAFDANGLGDMKILVNTSIYRLDLGATTQNPWTLERTWATDGNNVLSRNWIIDRAPRVIRPHYFTLAVGNFDELPGEEIVTLENFWQDNEDFGFGMLTVLYYENGLLNFAGQHDEFYGFMQLAETPMYPVLAPMDVDDDGVRLRYTGVNRTVFSEPMINAVLSSPPFDATKEQADSTTAFGESDSSGGANENRIGASWSATVGFKTPDGGLGLPSVEVTATARGAVTNIQSSSYNVTTSTTRTTGPGEDNVIFSTVPYDQYEYEIISAPAASDLVNGEPLVISLPRDPITVSVTREFFNAAVGSSLQVGSSVIGHQIGQIQSYPTTAERDVLLGANGERGLASELKSVGQGTGNTEVAIEVQDEFSEGNKFEIGFELSFKATGGGAIYGASVGTSSASTTTITTGTGLKYVGVVGNMNVDFDPYQWGLFTYIHRGHASGQEFPVINYWVE